MFPLSARVLFPAVVSLVTGLWAASEFLAERRYRMPEPIADVPDDDWRITQQERQAAADDRAERKLRLQEIREARLSGKVNPADDN